MEAKQYAKIRRASITAATKGGFASDGEDFAQEAASKIAAGRKATVGQLFIDYLRETYGNTTSGSDTRTALSALRYTASRAYVDVHGMEKTLPAEDAPACSLDFFNIVDTLDKHDRADLILMFKWGFSLRELGELHGYSESRASQRMTVVLNTLRKRLAQAGAAIRDPATQQPNRIGRPE